MRLIVLPGDGIGPEIMGAAMQALEALNGARGLGLVLERDVVGLESLARHGSTLRPELAARLPGYDGIILGPADTAAYPAAEVTEGFYADRNMHEGNADLLATPDVAISLRKVTRQASARIARRAFELAMTRGRRVTAVHKANVMKRSDGLFLESVRTVAREFPDVTLDDVIVDAMAAWLVRAPERFDVVVAGNLYGDILSDLASELSGSLGLAGSIMAGDSLCAAQAQHGSAPDIAGHDRANPSSMILSVAMLLEWLGARHGRADLAGAGSDLKAAVDRVLADPATRTADLGGTLGCAAFGEAVTRAVLAG
jgi:3-isopropylmalate dehydrogenase